MEIFAEIGEQWPLILIFVGCVGIFYFRKEIKVFLTNKRITGVAGLSVDDTEVEEQQEEAIQPEKKLGSTGQSVDNSNRDEAVEIPEQDMQATLPNLFVHIIHSRFEEASTMSEALIKEADNNIEKTRINVIYQYYLLAYSTRGNLDQLVSYVGEHVKAPEVLALANYYLGWVYEKYDNYPLALDYLEKGYSGLEVEDDKVDCVIKICSCHSKLHGIEKGIAEFRRYLISFEKEHKAKLYEKLSELYDAKGDKEMQFFALEMAHANDILSKNYEFGAAYHADDNGVFKFVQLYHYNALVNKVGNKEYLYETITNNRGVVLSDLNLEGLSIDDYFKSKDSGGTLAVANLAYILIRNGFHDMAEELLVKASKIKNPHDNIWSALQEVKKVRKEQTEQFKTYSAIGRKVFQLTQKLAEKKLNEAKNTIKLNGVWDIIEVDHKDLVIRKKWENLKQEVKDDSLDLIWDEAEDKTGFLSLKFSKDETAFAEFSDKKGKYVSFHEYRGYAIFHEDTISVFVNQDEDVKFFRLSRSDS